MRCKHYLVRLYYYRNNELSCKQSFYYRILYLLYSVNAPWACLQRGKKHSVCYVDWTLKLYLVYFLFLLIRKLLIVKNVIYLLLNHTTTDATSDIDSHWSRCSNVKPVWWYKNQCIVDRIFVYFRCQLVGTKLLKNKS